MKFNHKTTNLEQDEMKLIRVNICKTNTFIQGNVVWEAALKCDCHREATSKAADGMW